MKTDALPRTLGLSSSLAVVIGITIGSGIFRTPAGVARMVPDAPLMLALWVAGALITVCGALSIAELAAALPESGGYYAYLREGWGRPAAFLFGWAQLVLIRASALGGIALVFAEYALRTFGVDPVEHVSAARFTAAAAISFATVANILGARVGAAIVSASSWTKFLALFVLIGAAFALGGAHGGTLAHFSSTGGTAGLDSPAGGTIGIGALGLGLVSVLWAYDGFGDLSVIGGEAKDPGRTLPRAIILGTTGIVLVYLLANAAYLFVSPIADIARSPLIAADTMTAIFGRSGAVVVSALVMISTFSTLNADVLAMPRIFFAMAEDGLLFSALARVHARFRTPYLAILLSALLGVALVFSQSFERLSSTFVLAVWPFYALAVAALFRLRRLRPDLPRPYRVAGYPVVPAIFVLSVAWFVVNALVTDPVPTAITFALILAGAPVYVLFFRSRVGFR